MTSAWSRDAAVLRLTSHVCFNYASLMLVIIATAITSSRAFPFPTDPWEESEEELEPTMNTDSDDFPIAPTPYFFDYAPYMNSIKGPLQETDLDNDLDLNDRELAKKFDFDPDHLLTLMIDNAAAQNTTPKKFYEEIKDMMILQNRSKTESKESSESSTKGPQESYEASTFKSGNSLDNWPPNYSVKKIVLTDPEPPTVMPETTTLSTLPKIARESSEEHWETTLKHLEEKYNVSSECHSPDSITPFRLALMFPHYINFGQKPFVAPSYVSAPRENSHTTVRVPTFFKNHEFGGLIPRLENSLAASARCKLIAIHLYSVYGDEEKKGSPIPFRTKSSLVKWRMEKSLLSDERRIRLLENNNVIDEHGQVTSEILNLYNNFVTREFYNKMFWKMFKQ